ncbi:hypothetical protein Godav_005038 [Gossypium davidsonii]|uniref:MYB-CC type transcription factor LHEQLE-containing domain-containing protein n=1 Tax=Gossypium davidsonii TaxID=34287 RepID=A0A7J8SN50_GOSDV|nr:hypothetical protein [Gossypium davidsonii]
MVLSVNNIRAQYFSLYLLRNRCNLLYYCAVTHALSFWCFIYLSSQNTDFTSDIQQVQRQLQLRIEAQGKYLKKIIEEQRLGGVLAEAPGTGASVPALGDNGLESDKKTDPATPAPTSESPLQDKAAKEGTSAKSHSVDESFSSHHEPLTPDSGCHVGSPAGSPKGEMLKKKQRVSMAGAFAKPEMVLPHQILDSSINASYQQSQSVFMGEQFNPSSGISIRNENQSGKGSATEL